MYLNCQNKADHGGSCINGFYKFVQNDSRSHDIFFRIFVGFILTSLISKISNPTKYPRIFYSNEPIPDRAFLQDHLQKLEEIIKSDEFEKTMEILKTLVPGYSIFLSFSVF